MDLLYAHVARQDAERAAQEARHAAERERHAAEMAEMRNEINALKQNQAAPPVTVGRDLVINIDQRSFTIKVFGAENTQHITRERVRVLLDDCIDSHKTPRLAAHAAIEGLVGFIYCDPEHPENFTCYQPNQKEPVALVHTAKGWQRRPVDEVLSPMTVRAADALFAKQPCVGYLKYDPVVTYIIDNEHEFERGEDAKNALALLKQYLAATLTELPVEGGVLQLADGASEPRPLNVPTRWKGTRVA